MNKFKQIKRNISFWWFYKNFFKKFSFYISSHEEELQELYKIRYEVYCQEYSYIPKEKTKNNLEFDNWDAHSTHFIIRDLNNEISATVRLILNSSINLPIQKHFKFNVSTNNIDFNQAAEISRFIVIKKYRKHHLMFVLMKGIYLFVKEKHIENVFSVMDDKLFPLLLKIGVPFRKIGPPSIYQGFTYPCILNIAELENELRSNNKKLLKYLTEGGVNFGIKKNKYSVS
ncbi:MAG: GNAT family N-acyltransferase [Patescibacteria group bacterium]|jgi:N-acyl-L-homoserine lactone synthetase